MGKESRMPSKPPPAGVTDPIAIIRNEVFRRRDDAIEASDTYGDKNDLDMDGNEEVAVELDGLVSFIDQLASDQRDEVRDLRSALRACLEYIDALPEDIVAKLSAMPDFDRDRIQALV